MLGLLEGLAAGAHIEFQGWLFVQNLVWCSLTVTRGEHTQWIVAFKYWLTFTFSKLGLSVCIALHLSRLFWGLPVTACSLQDEPATVSKVRCMSFSFSMRSGHSEICWPHTWAQPTFLRGTGISGNFKLWSRDLLMSHLPNAWDVRRLLFLALVVNQSLHFGRGAVRFLSSGHFSFPSVGRELL